MIQSEHPDSLRSRGRRLANDAHIAFPREVPTPEQCRLCPHRDAPLRPPAHLPLVVENRSLSRDLDKCILKIYI